MGLPVTSGDPSRGETLDRTVSRGSLFASGVVEKVGMVRMIPLPEFTENRYRVPDWCRRYDVRCSAAPKVSLCGVSPFRSVVIVGFGDGRVSKA